MLFNILVFSVFACVDTQITLIVWLFAKKKLLLHTKPQKPKKNDCKTNY